MSSINSIMDIARSGLFASQSAIQVTGNNIANVDTEGYTRRTLRLEESIPINTAPGQMGTGVNATEVVRSFDRFLENNYNDKASMRDRYEATWEQLQGVESLLNESSTDGISYQLEQFFSDWQGLTSDPDDYALRQTLVTDAESLVALMQQAEDNLGRMQQQVDEYIEQDVKEVNEILNAIAQINQQINAEQVDGQNNPNELYDERDRQIRELASKMDINVIDNGKGNMTITDKAGHTLVDGVESFRIAFESAQAFDNLTAASNFDGQVYFEGASEFEFKLDVVNGGSVTSGAGAAEFRVSLDGGRTWLKDDDGNEKLFAARPESHKIEVEGVDIWFGTPDSSTAAPTENLEVDDGFNIVPKKGLYWYKNTSSKENISPQIRFDGTDDTRRLTGGSLAGYMNFRDHYIGDYTNKLDAVAETLVWEVNQLHAEGAGLTHFSTITGSYSVDRTDTALASNSSGLAFNERLQAGNAMIYTFDADSGETTFGGPLDFGSGAAFNPNTHSLQDVAAAIDRTFSDDLDASIVNNRLKIEAADGVEFSFGTDTGNLFAALGVNTFFDGHTADNISLNTNIGSDLSRIAAGHINGGTEALSGDDTTALAIAKLSQKEVSIRTVQDGTVNQTMTEFYNTLVANVGADSAASRFSYSYNNALAQDLNTRQQEISGVNLDEEMSKLIKFQHSYTAAAKLISTADQMMQTLLGLKQ